jgi:hypothetical protein
MEFSQANDNDDLYSHENIVLAVLSNVIVPPDTPDYTIDLKKIDICECEFLQLFFNYSTNNFNINSSNTFSKLISLKGQKFVSYSNQIVPFNFTQTILSKLAEKYSKTSNSVNTLSKLSALKTSSQINSLAQVRGFQKSLTWYETIDLLISSNTISSSSNPLSVAYALLTVQFIFVEPSSDLSIAINYNYNVEIPGYTNIEVESPPFTYSLDEKYCKKSTNKQIFQESQIDDDSDDEDEDESCINSNQNDDESIGYSITNSILQQIKLVQHDSCCDEDMVSMNDDIDTWV